MPLLVNENQYWSFKLRYMYIYICICLNCWCCATTDCLKNQHSQMEIYMAVHNQKWLPCSTLCHFWFLFLFSTSSTCCFLRFNLIGIVRTRFNPETFWLHVRQLAIDWERHKNHIWYDLIMFCSCHASNVVHIKWSSNRLFTVILPIEWRE